MIISLDLYLRMRQLKSWWRLYSDDLELEAPHARLVALRHIGVLTVQIAIDPSGQNWPLTPALQADTSAE